MLNEQDIIEMKRIRINDKHIITILKEIFVFLAFLVVLLQVALSNLSSSSLQYNYLFQSTFVDMQNELLDK